MQGTCISLTKWSFEPDYQSLLQFEMSDSADKESSNRVRRQTTLPGYLKDYGLSDESRPASPQPTPPTPSQRQPQEEDEEEEEEEEVMSPDGVRTASPISQEGYHPAQWLPTDNWKEEFERLKQVQESLLASMQELRLQNAEPLRSFTHSVKTTSTPSTTVLTSSFSMPLRNVPGCKITTAVGAVAETIGQQSVI